MQTVNSPEELKQILLNPNPNSIYAIIPNGYTVDSHTVERAFDNLTNILVYGDVKIINKDITLLKFNPSFDINIVLRRFALDSPLFIKANHPVYIQSNNVNEIALEILSQIPGIHIPKLISRWTQN